MKSTVMNRTVAVPACPGAPGLLMRVFLAWGEQRKPPLGENFIIGLEG